MKHRTKITQVSALALLLTLAAGSSAFAQTGGQPLAATGDITSAHAVATAQKLLPIPKGFIVVNSTYQNYYSPAYGPVYMVMFQQPTPEASPQGPFAFVQATVDAKTGQILQYFQNSPFPYSLSASHVSQSRAQDMAQTWLAKLDPQHAQMSLVSPDYSGLTPLTSAGQHSFAFARMYRGIPVAFQSAVVTLDGSGQLVNYQAFWESAALPPRPAQTLAQPIAEQDFIKALQLTLTYVAPFNTAINSTPGPQILAYAPSQNAAVAWPMGIVGLQSALWVSAATGKPLSAFGQPLAPAVAYTPLVKGGPAQLPYPHHTLLSQTQALALAKAVVPSGFALANTGQSSVMSSNPGAPTFYWNFSFAKTGQSSYSVTVDPLLHMILSVNQFYMGAVSQGAAPAQSSPAGHTRSLSHNRLTAIATAYVEKLNPQLTGALALNRVSGFTGQAGVADRSFVVLDHGIPVQDETMNVTLNRLTGEVTAYYAGFFQPSSIPAPGRVVPLSQAEQAFAKAQPVRLEYVLPVRANPSVQATAITGGQNPYEFSSRALLVYVPQGSGPAQFYNAETGHWQAYQSTGSSVIPADIKGHSGEHAMLLLIQNGALAVQNGKVHPDAAMTRGQFVKMLVTANGYYTSSGQLKQAFLDVTPRSPSYSAVQQAVAGGILQPGGDFHPNQPISRNDAAHWLVTFLGYQTLASESGLFQLPFHDASAIPAGDQGDAAIAARLGLIPPQKGDWNGTRPLTVAEASVAVVAALRIHSGHAPSGGTASSVLTASSTTTASSAPGTLSK